MSVIKTIGQLEAIYGHPNDASTVKVADRITRAYRILIEKSPFAALATCGPEGLDCSPRGAGAIALRPPRSSVGLS
jgi:predicted pyridoxine 5'-phosphate oxidase superfamily flavin-nucleotide-binding protein